MQRSPPPSHTPPPPWFTDMFAFGSEDSCNNTCVKPSNFRGGGGRPSLGYLVNRMAVLGYLLPRIECGHTCSGNGFLLLGILIRESNSVRGHGFIALFERAPPGYIGRWLSNFPLICSTNQLCKKKNLDVLSPDGTPGYHHYKATISYNHLYIFFFPSHSATAVGSLWTITCYKRYA